MRYMTTKTRPVSTMDQLMNSMFYDTPVVKPRVTAFSVDVIENEDEYIVTAELPGFSESEVEVSLNENLMVISALKKVEEKEDSSTHSTSSGTANPEAGDDTSTSSATRDKVNYLLKERAEGQYKRSFSLPKDADREAIKATLKDGVLNLSISKKPEAKPLSIKIN